MSKLRNQPKKILARDAAVRLFEEWTDDIVGSVTYGLTAYNSVPAESRVDWRPRTRANALNDYIVADAIRRFQDEKKVVIDDDYESVFFIFDGRAALRFKKVTTSDRRPKNAKTTRQTEIWSQTEIEGIERATYINLQYCMSPTWTEVKDVWMTCLQYGKLEWSIPIAGELTGYMFDSKGKATDTARARVRSTKPRAEKKDG